VVPPGTVSAPIHNHDMTMTDLLWGWDLAILGAVNGHAGASVVLDKIVAILADSYLLKSLPPLLVWWGLWFAHPGERNRPVREKLLASLGVTVLAIVVGRLLATVLPFRARPLSDPTSGAVPALGFETLGWDEWSSLPSDHAVLFFALGTSIYLIRRGPGLALLAQAALVISLPRIYLGLHYPGDILAGAVVGVAIGRLALAPTARVVAWTRVLEVELRHAWLFYPMVFFVTFQAASMFDSLRVFLRGTYAVASIVVLDGPYRPAPMAISRSGVNPGHGTTPAGDPTRAGERAVPAATPGGTAPVLVGGVRPPS
jgi:undecaprenyl-diphosphatase